MPEIFENFAVGAGTSFFNTLRKKREGGDPTKAVNLANQLLQGQTMARNLERATRQEKSRVDQERAALQADELRLQKQFQSQRGKEAVSSYYPEQEPVDSYKALRNIFSKLTNDERDELLQDISNDRYRQYAQDARDGLRNSINTNMRGGAYRGMSLDGKQSEMIDPQFAPVLEAYQQVLELDPPTEPEEVQEYIGLIDSWRKAESELRQRMNEERTKAERKMQISAQLRTKTQEILDLNSYADVGDLWEVITGLESGLMSLDDAQDAFSNMKVTIMPPNNEENEKVAPRPVQYPGFTGGRGGDERQQQLQGFHQALTNNPGQDPGAIAEQLGLDLNTLSENEWAALEK